MLVNPSNFAKTNYAISDLLNGEFGKVNLSLSHNFFFKSSVILLSEKLLRYTVIESFSD